MLWAESAHAGPSAFPAAHMRLRSNTYQTQKSTAPSSSAPEIANRSRGDTPMDTEAHTRISTGVRLAAQLHRPRKAWAQKTQKDMKICLHMARERSLGTGDWIYSCRCWFTLICLWIHTCVSVISERERESKCVIVRGNIPTMLFVKSSLQGQKRERPREWTGECPLIKTADTGADEQWFRLCESTKRKETNQHAIYDF